jgi:hypothetical protein
MILQHACVNEVSYAQFHIATWYHPNGGVRQAGRKSASRRDEASQFLVLEISSTEAGRLFVQVFLGRRVSSWGKSGCTSGQRMPRVL